MLLAIVLMMVTMATADAKRKRVLKYDLCEMADPAFFKALDSVISKSIWKNVSRYSLIDVHLYDYNKYHEVKAGGAEQNRVYALCHGEFGFYEPETNWDKGHFVKYGKRLYKLGDWKAPYLLGRFVYNCSKRVVPKSEMGVSGKVILTASDLALRLYLWDPHEAKMTEVELVPELGKLYFEIME